MKYLLLWVGILWGIGVQAQELAPLRHLGNETAPVQMYLFSSYACPHCADFHQHILPKIQKKYLDNKKANLTFVEVANSKNTLLPILLTRCIGSQQAPTLSKQFYRQQKSWVYEENPRKKLWKIVQQMGMPQSEFDQCLSNRSLMEQVVDQQNNLSQIYDITKLPTLIVRHKNQVIKIEGADEKTVLNGIQDIFE